MRRCGELAVSALADFVEVALATRGPQLRAECTAPKNILVGLHAVPKALSLVFIWDQPRVVKRRRLTRLLKLEAVRLIKGSGVS